MIDRCHISPALAPTAVSPLQRHSTILNSAVIQRHPTQMRVSIICARLQLNAASRRRQAARPTAMPLTKRLATAIAFIVFIAGGAATAQPVGIEMSPAVTWDPYNEAATGASAHKLSASELKLARDRAARMFEAIKAAPAFSRPAQCATLLTSAARKDAATVLNQGFIPYCSRPLDVRRGKDGALLPVLGGAHQLVYFETNRVPRGELFVDRATRGDFSRGEASGGGPIYFAAPRVFGELAGGTLYADLIVFTQDGRSALVPAPLGALLEIEIARLGKVAREIEQGFAGRLKELEASMTPAAVAERRAKRERSWSKETRDPTALAQRLDAAHRTDESDYARQKANFSLDAPRDPSSTVWRPRLALEAAQAKLAALDAAGRLQPACARMESGFDSQSGVRYEVAGSVPQCVPMMQVRTDLLDPRRPVDEVQLMTVWFRQSECGARWTAPPGDAARDRCAFAVPLLREIDWAAARRAIGW